jgi:hypothetical protein
VLKSTAVSMFNAAPACGVPHHSVRRATKRGRPVRCGNESVTLSAGTARSAPVLPRNQAATLPFERFALALHTAGGGYRHGKDAGPKSGREGQECPVILPRGYNAGLAADAAVGGTARSAGERIMTSVIHPTPDKPDRTVRPMNTPGPGLLRPCFADTSLPSLRCEWGPGPILDTI